MREIKFRGKDKAGDWIFGGVTTDKYVIIEEYTTRFVPAKRNTVGQFTGFTDADDNEIFEDDIIQNEVNPFEIYKVAMVDGCWSAMNHIDCGVLHWFLENAPYKIIGNFHDNPNLLKEGFHYD